MSRGTLAEYRKPRSSLHHSHDVVSLAAMILASCRYYFWFYGYPKPAAEHGARS
jgi:hypothetical protein